jgi:hypothetical protein
MDDRAMRVAITAIVLTAHTSCQAQPEIQPQQIPAGQVQDLGILLGVDDFQFDIATDPSSEGLRKNFTRFMASTITKIDRTCGLTVAQKKRLTTASKGAVERAVGKWQRKTGDWQKAETQHIDLGFDLPIQNDLAKLEVPQVADSEVTDFVIPRIRSVAKESVWVKTLHRVLSREQKTKLKAFNAAQKAFNASQPDLDLDTPYRTKGGVI